MSLDDVTRGLESFAAAFGRAERLQAGSRPLSILLVKNPAGANEVFRTLVATAKSGERAGAARPPDRPQRRNRRRARHLVDLGCRLRDPRGTRRPCHLLGKPRAGARAATEVRGRARRAAGRRSGASTWRSSARCSRTEHAPCTRSRPTPRCSSFGSSSPLAAMPGATGKTREGSDGSRGGRLAGRRVRRLFGGHPALAGARRRGRKRAGQHRTRARSRSGNRQGQPRACPKRPRGDRRSTRARSCCGRFRVARASGGSRCARSSRTFAHSTSATASTSSLAPMQLFQLLPTPAVRLDALRRVFAHLRPGGRAAIALLDLEAEPVGDDYSPPLPDILERDGRVYSSQPIAIRFVPDPGGGGVVELDRVRQAVSPGGEIDESFSQVRLAAVSPRALERGRRPGRLPGGGPPPCSGDDRPCRERGRDAAQARGRPWLRASCGCSGSIRST